MKNKRKIPKKVLIRRDSLFQTFEDGQDCLMGKPANCKCPFCLRPDQITHKQPTKRTTTSIFETNFDICLRNPYSFIIMHLKNEDNKNPLGLIIPEICLFHQGTPWDIYYSCDNHIRGYKTKDHQKLRQADLLKIFKQLQSRSSQQTNNRQMHLARFVNNEYMMLSDIDLAQICFKSRTDPIWSRLQYIHNRLPVQNYQPIVRHYSSEIEYPQHIVKLAAESLVGYTDEDTVRNFLDEDSYLDYCNIKICDFLNYKHNIRVSKADFSYLKSYSGRFIFVNADQIEYSNLTQALKRRQEKLERQIMKKNSIIILTPRRQAKLKHRQVNPMVKVLEDKMNEQFDGQLREYNFSTVRFSTNEQTKNEMAFKRLHPLVTSEYKQMLTSANWQDIKDRIFQNKRRRPLVSQSKSRSFSFVQPVVSEDKLPFRLHTKPEFRPKNKRRRNTQTNRNKPTLTTTNFSLRSRFASIRTESRTLQPFW